MEEVLEIQEQQVPLQEDPPIKKLYRGLYKDKKYTKSFDEFRKQYSTPDAIDKLYTGLTEDGDYTKSKDEFQKQYFSDVKKKVGSIGLEESSLQVGNALSQSGGVGGEEIPQIEMYQAGEELVPTDPISISKKYKELSTRKKTISAGTGSTFAMGTGSTEVEDEEAKKQAEKIRKDFPGLDIEGINEDFGWLADDDYWKIPKQKLLKDRENNPQLFQREVANLKWQRNFQEALFNSNISPEEYDRVNHLMNQLPIAASQGDYTNQRPAIQSLAKDIQEYGGERKDEILKNFAIEVAKVYGNPDSKASETFKGTPESQYLTPEAQLGYQYIEDVSPEKAAQYKRLFRDKKDLSEDELKGYNNLMQTLEETGVGLQQNAVREELNSLNEQAQRNGGLSEGQIQRATKLEEKNNELAINANELDNKYPDRLANKVDDAVQEILGQRIGWGNYAGGKVWQGFRNTGQGIWEMVSTPFMSDESNALRELAIMGEKLEDEKIYHKTDKNKSVVYDELVIDPELQKQIDVIKNNGVMSQSQKEQQLYNLLYQNKDKFGRIPIKGGKFNLNASSILYGVTDLATTLAPFIAIEAATGGIGGAGAGAKFLRTFTAAQATTFHDEYAGALLEGKSQSEAYKSAMASTAINSFAMAGAGTPMELKAMAKGNSSAERLIRSMSDDAIQKVLDKGTPKGLKGIAQSLKERGKQIPQQFTQGLKTGAKFEAYMAGANTLNDRELDFKQMLVNIGNFGILGTGLGQVGYKSPTQLQKSAGLKFGEKPDDFISAAQRMKNDGLLSESEFNQRKSLIESYSEAYKKMPKADDKGNELSESKKAEYLYNSVIKNEGRKSAQNLPPKQAEKAEHTAKVADYENGILLEEPTDKQLDSRANKLKSSIEKKDEQGKSELSDKEMADAKAELEAINNTIEKRKDTSIKEEELPDLTEPIEGTDKKGVPIGENVPSEIKGEPEVITQPIELSVEGKPVRDFEKEKDDLVKERDERIVKEGKPDVKLEFLNAKELVDSQDPVGNKKRQRAIIDKYKEMRKLFDCLWT